MSIVILLDRSANRAEVVVRLQKVTGRSLQDIRNVLQSEAPFVDIELYEGDFDAHAAMLRAVLACIDEFSLPCRIYELPEGETMNSCMFVKECEIGPKVLLEILRADEDVSDW